MEDESDGGMLREGRDFRSAEQLRERTRDAPAKTQKRTVGERLAEVVADELRWLRATGELPGGLPWDRQPAWRVRLWEHALHEEERLTRAAL